MPVVSLEMFSHSVARYEEVQKVFCLVMMLFDCRQSFYIILSSNK